MKEKSENNNPAEIEDEFTAASDNQSVNSQDNFENKKDTNSESSQSESDEDDPKSLEENNIEAESNSNVQDNGVKCNNTDREVNIDKSSNESSSKFIVNDAQNEMRIKYNDCNFKVLYCIQGKSKISTSFHNLFLLCVRIAFGLLFFPENNMSTRYF